jgi:hypothetical protein
MSASDGSQSFEILKCRDDVVFDLLAYISGQHVVITHDLLESSERMIREACPVQSVEIVRDVVVHGEK